MNEAIFENILVGEGRIVEAQYRELFEPVLGTPEFEQRSLELQTNYLPRKKSLPTEFDETVRGEKVSIRAVERAE